MRFKKFTFFDLNTKIVVFLLVAIGGLYFNSFANIESYFKLIFNPKATISSDVDKICLGESATITFKGTEGTAPFKFTYELNGNLQDLITSNTEGIANISLQGTTVGSFTYKLINVEDDTNTSLAVSDQEITITVNTPPTVDFSFNNNACSGETIQFNSNETGNGAFTYNWDFGDGITSTSKDPTHVFDNLLGCGTRDFDVTLTVTDINGCSATKSNKITIKEKPDIEFFDISFNGFSNCGNASSSDPNYTINVDNNSNSSCITSFFIDWGDGTTGVPLNFPVSHTYTEIGVFNMKIKVTGDNNCVNEISYQIKNVSNPAGGITSPGNTSNLCLDSSELTFPIENWESNSSDTTYRIDFGDGTSNEVFTQADIKNNNNITHNYLKGSCSQPNGEFIATLYIENACSTTTSTTDSIIILEPSIANFESINDSCINSNIVFTNKSIIGDNPNCSKAANFKWDFGDGTIINDNNTNAITNQVHSYTSAGTYTVTLSVSSRCGIDTFTKDVCIEPDLTPSFSLNADAGCIPLNINTTNTTDKSQLCGNPSYEWEVLYADDNCGATAEWAFINGTDEKSENPEFTFNTPGKYTLVQTIATSCGTETSQKIIDVKKPPTVSIEPIDDFCGATTINPIANIENCTTNVAGITYNWTFTGGNPVNSNSLEPGNIVYENAGIYEITLQVTSECGVSNIAKQTFEIFEKPVITNANLTQEICSGQTTQEIVFTTNNNATSYIWTATASSNISGFITSGNSNTIPSQTLINNTNNSGTVKYTVMPNLGSCEGDAVEFIVTVNPSPIISKQPVSSEICLDGNPTQLEVEYQNGTGTPAYQWFSNTNNSNTGGTLINTATNSTYDPPSNTVGTIFYYAEITFTSGGCSKISSDVASVIVNPQITVDAIAPHQTVCAVGTADELQVSFSGGTGNATYKWYSNTTNSNAGGTEIAGQTASTFTPNTFTTVGDFFFYAEISLDGNGCSLAKSDVFQISVIADPVIDAQPIASQELCQNATATDLTVDVSGGSTSPKMYQWFLNTTNSNAGGTLINGANTNTYLPETTDIGTFYYYVVVSQTESGCEVISEVSALKVNEAPTINKQPISSEICLNGTANLLEVEYENGTGVPTYQWFSSANNSNSGGTKINGETNSTYNPPTDIVGEIFYYVEISFSSGGCPLITSQQASIIVNQIPVIDDAQITIYSEDTFIFSPNSIASNTVPSGTQYTWSTPTFIPVGSIIGTSAETSPQNQISQTLENTGTSPIIVTYIITPDTTKCIGDSFTLEVTVNPNISSNAIITNISCFEANDGSISTNIEGGIPFDNGNPYLISWIGPNGFSSTNPTITNLEAGLYNLRIEDKTGFFITEEWRVTQPDVLAITTDLEKNISCFQGNDGVIEVTISGGTTPYQFNWTTTNGSGILPNIKNQNALTAGIYTLEIIDKNNCIETKEFTLTEPDGLKIEEITKLDILCFGDATGALEIDVSGGTKVEISTGVFDYRYNWSGPNGYTSSSKNINNLIAGTYKVAVTDQLGCTTNADFIINQSPEIEINYTKIDVTCYGETDGKIDLTVIGGKEPYQVSWSNLGNGFSQSNLSAGTYIATITDGNNCIKRTSIIIDQPIFFIDPTVSPISCNGENDGAIDLNLTGGVAPFTVTWSDDSSAGIQRNNLPAGSYTVTILDSDVNQCPITQTFIFTDPPAIAVSSTVIEATDCDKVNSGSIDLEVSGGSKPYTFLWNTNETTEDLNEIPPGDYSVTITDKNGCSLIRTFNIFRQDPLNTVLEEETITDCDLKTVSKKITPKVTGGFLPYTYSWSAGTTSGVDDSIMTTSQNGAYTLTITDERGCTNSQSYLVNVPEIGDADFRYNAFALTTYDLLSIKDPIQFTNLSTGDFNSLKWDFGDGSPTTKEENPIHTYDAVGSFEVTLIVEFTAGCIEIFKRTITITKGYSLINPTAFTPNGDGYNETIRPSHRGFTSLEMSIYDNWGTRIFYEESLKLVGWNGNVGNKPAENGNYVMVVKGVTFYEKEIMISSPVTLLK